MGFQICLKIRLILKNNFLGPRPIKSDSLNWRPRNCSGDSKAQNPIPIWKRVILHPEALGAPERSPVGHYFSILEAEFKDPDIEGVTQP